MPPFKQMNSKTNSSVEKQSNKRLTKKRNQSLNAFLNNLDFLEQHKKLFETIPINGNNSNLYFENNLRHYSHIKLKSLHSHSTAKLKNNNKANRSSVTVKEQAKQVVKKTEKRLKRSRLTQNRREFIEVILPPCETNEASQFFEEDTEEEAFYSANSVDTQSLNKKSNSKRILAKKVSDKMEDGDEILDQPEENEDVEDPGTGAGEEDEGEDDQQINVSPENETDIEEMTETAENDGGGEEAPTDTTDVFEGETTDEDIKDIQEMIKEASKELENMALVDESDAGEVPPPTVPVEGGSVFKFNAANDAALLEELDHAERQARETSQKISVLKERLTELLKKEVCTEVEAKELEQLNKELKALMQLLEEKTKRIQFLTAQANLFENMILPQPMLQIKRAEDALPKVIVCGLTEANIPKLIVCDDLKKKKKHRRSTPRSEQISNQLPVVKPKFDNYNMRQENLIQRRCTLRTEPRPGPGPGPGPNDQLIENLQRKFLAMQNEMRNICQEHAALQTKIKEFYERASQKQQACGKKKGVCPAEMELRVKEYTETTKQLEQQLYSVENEMCNLQSELCALQCERQQLERTSDQGKRTAICPPPAPPICPPICTPNTDRQLRELKEQYNCLQDDFKNKLTEVACLRADNEKLKQTSMNGESIKRLSDDRSRDYDRFSKTNGQQNFMGNKEQLMELEQQMNVAKQRFREAQDELEELRALMQDQQAQINEYRNKYLEAQQVIEEQRRQISILEMDTLRINEEINLDIQQVKNQFQQKLEELSPLPDLLKTTQMKLQETEQMYALVEKNNENLQRELQIYKDKIEEITNSTSPNGAEPTVSQLQNENDCLRNELERIQYIAEENSREAQRNAHEIAQLMAQLENVREESARQVARTKDRCEIVRRSMQNQIADLECQLAQSRAQSKSIQKERDEIRRMMQVQINNLNQNFQDAQLRIRSLQGHVEFLKEPPYNGGDADFSEACGCAPQF